MVNRAQHTPPKKKLYDKIEQTGKDSARFEFMKYSMGKQFSVWCCLQRPR